MRKRELEVPPEFFSFALACYDVSHPGKRAFIDWLTRVSGFEFDLDTGRGQRTFWVGSNPHSHGGGAMKGARQSMLLMEGDDPTDRDFALGDGRYLGRLSDRRHFRFRCPLCNLTVSVRGENLDPVLDQLANAAGESGGRSRRVDLPLALLAARVSR